jgi:hypothetical protein
VRFGGREGVGQAVPDNDAPSVRHSLTYERWQCVGFAINVNIALDIFEFLKDITNESSS